MQIINLRSIRPLDRATVNTSVRKMNRLVTVEEGFPQHCVGAEIWLNSPLQRFVLTFDLSKLNKCIMVFDSAQCSSNWGELRVSWCASWEDCWGWCSHASCGQSWEISCSSGRFTFTYLGFWDTSYAGSAHHNYQLNWIVVIFDDTMFFNSFNWTHCTGRRHCLCSKES